MLNVTVVTNGIQELGRAFPEQPGVRYRAAPMGADFAPDLSATDVLLVPNGSDHVALAKAKTEVRRFLDAGGTLFCFDGWFTDWVPGNQWVMDNSKPTKDVRYRVGTDRHGLLDAVAIDDFVFHHGISGWWACGYTWERPVAVLDAATTAGTMLLTASGPLPAAGRREAGFGPNRLFTRALALAAARAGTTLEGVTP